MSSNSKKKTVEYIVGEGEKTTLHQHFSCPTMFSTFAKANSNISAIYNLSSASGFNFYKSENLSSGKEFKWSVAASSFHAIMTYVGVWFREKKIRAIK